MSTTVGDVLSGEGSVTKRFGDIGASTGGPDEGLIPGAPDEGVIPGAPDEGVIPVGPDEGVIADPTNSELRLFEPKYG